MRHLVSSSMAGILFLAACGDSLETTESDFELESPLSATVVENVKACTVDAVCGLRLRLADTSVFALYGTGERAENACRIDVAVSDAAFEASTGQVVNVVLKECEDLGLVLDDLALPGGGS